MKSKIKNQKSKNCYRMGLVMCVALMCCVNLWALEEEGDFVVCTKTVGGAVNIIRPHYITIDITKDPESTRSAEMYFPITEAVEFVNKSLDQIEEGNVVEVTYDEYSRLDEQGKERYVRRTTTAIRFLNLGKTDKLISR